MRGWESFSDSISGMFEGSISDPSSLNRMVLNTGSGASDSVDTSVYGMLSLAGKASRTLDIDLYWIDASGDTQDVDLGIDLTTDWEEPGPVDLDDLTSGTWSAKKASTIWLEFGSGSSLATPVRIGWIRLTE